MFAPLLTVFLFAASAVAGERTARYWGSQQGNLIRLFLATIILGMVTVLVFPDSLHGPTYGWLFLSGLIGFGLGDIALFMAYVRIGSRLTILLNLCTAPLWSSLVEWLWLGTTLGAVEMISGSIILAGVGMAIFSREPGLAQRHGSRWVGILCGLLAGCGQGMGAVVSRKALETARDAGFVLNGMSAAAQRVSGGFLTTLVIVVVWRMVGKQTTRAVSEAGRGKRVGWLAATTLCGPVFGVSCFQWALMDQPAGVVNAVVATTPIAMIPLAVLIDGERPRVLSVAGAALAVAGVVVLFSGG